MHFRPSLSFALATLLLASPVLASAEGFLSRGDFVSQVMSSTGHSVSGGNCFRDVSNQSFAPAVCAAKNHGFVSGYSDGTFRPNQPVSLVEAAKVILLAEGVSVGSDSIWYRPYIEQLAEWDAIPRSIVNILAPLTLSQVSEILSGVENRGSDDNDDDNNDENNDIDLTITADDSTVDAGDTVEFTIKLENNDNQDHEVDVTATLDSDMTFSSATSGYDRNGRDFEWDNIDVNEDDTETLRLTVRVDSDLNDGDTVVLKVEAGDDNESRTIRIDEGNSSNNDGDVQVTISDSPDPVDAGDRVTYTIRLENNDNTDHTVDVTATLDDQMDFVSTSGGGDDDGEEVQWDNIRVREDSTTSLTLRVDIDDNADDGDTVRLQVEAGDDEDTETTRIDGNGSSNNGGEDIEVTIEDTDDPIEPGDRVTYRIRLRNTGNDTQDVDVTAALDPDTDFISASDDGDDDGDEVQWENIEVRENETKTILLTVETDSDLNDGDTVRLDVEAGDDEDTETTTFEEDDTNGNSDEVTVTITDEDDPVEPGDLLEYRIELENDDSTSATVDVTATLDDQVSFVSASSGGDHSGDDVDWNNVSVARRSTKVLVLTVRVLSSVDDGDTIRLRVETDDDSDTENTDVQE